MKKKPTIKRLDLVLCGAVTRALKNVKGLRGTAYVVGGVITEGATLRDIDIVISNLADMEKLRKALGKLASRAHFILQKGEPKAPIFVKITGKIPAAKSTKIKNKKSPKDFYAEAIE